MSEVTLYWHILSQQSRTAKTLLDMLEMPCKYVFVDLIKQENRKPEFLAISPFGNLPVLVQGDLIITEAPAILVYLCQKYHDKIGHLLGQGPL